jgi:mRNA interferase MazF
MKRLSVIYEPFSVVIVSFPFTDIKLAKKRPAVILSSKQHQIHSGHSTLAMITSANKSNWQSDHRIGDLNKAGLKIPCIIRQKLFSLDNRIIIATIGQLAQSDRDQLIFQLSGHFKLDQHKN